MITVIYGKLVWNKSHPTEMENTNTIYNENVPVSGRLHDAVNIVSEQRRSMRLS